MGTLLFVCFQDYVQARLLTTDQDLPMYWRSLFRQPKFITNVNKINYPGISLSAGILKALLAVRYYSSYSLFVFVNACFVK